MTATIGTATIGGGYDWYSYDSIWQCWAESAGKHSMAGTVFSSGVETESSRVSQFEEVAGDLPVVEKIVPDPEVSGFSRSEKVQNLPASGSSSEVSAHQMARSEIVPASGISSELSAHRIAQSASSSSVSVPPSIPNSLDSAGLWSIRQSSRCEDHFLLAAIQKPAAFRTRIQKILHEKTTARKDAEEDERSRWLHILAGIEQNTETPIARLLKEKPGTSDDVLRGDHCHPGTGKAHRLVSLPSG